MIFRDDCVCIRKSWAGFAGAVLLLLQQLEKMNIRLCGALEIEDQVKISTSK
jgi:hypothetical protein